MLKFFLHVDSIKLRLKSGMLDVLVKQQAVRLVICPQREIINGLALIGTSAEFHIPTKESLLTIQVILSVSNDRKFAGETSLVIDEYEPNVPYHKEAKLVNSADKSAAILFGFYYFHCGREEVSRPLCSAQGFTEIVTGMKNQNNSLF